MRGEKEGVVKQKVKILVVDDEKLIGKTLKRIIERDGIWVYFVVSAKQAIEALAKETFKLIIADIKMPEMDGISLLKNIRLSEPSIPIAMLTGFATPELALESRHSGASCFIAKPFDAQVILDIVQASINQNKSCKKWREYW